MNTAMVLGASGGFGAALVKVMADKGWNVDAVSRSGNPEAEFGAASPAAFATGSASASATASATASAAERSAHHTETPKVNWIKASITDHETMTKCAASADVIVHAINVPYPKWDPIMIDYTQRIIDLAMSENAHLLFVGNIYNVGIPSNGVVDEHTPDAPINDKGALRARLETMLATATENGLRCTVLRFGDFFGPNIRTPNWMNECIKPIHKNKLTIPGEMNVSHAWAYLPDAATAMERVASLRLQDSTLPAYMELPFAGHQFSFSELKASLESIMGTTLKTKNVPWSLFKLFGIVVPLFRDIYSMRYLWDNSIRIDGSALTELLGSAPESTPLRDALKRTVEGQN
jgi:nucleoside-diphosphate-sugar epimerase